MSDPEPSESADGRTARRDRNRDAVLDAVLDLFAEDSLTPAPAEVAERSGVSLRSVYRYFEDMDALARAAIARHLARMEPLFLLDEVGEGELGDRIDRIVAARLRLYEAAAPMARAAVVHARTNLLIRERLDETRLVMRRQIEAMFAPELSRAPEAASREVGAALDVLLGLESIEHLRRHRRLSGSETGRVLRRSARALLEDLA